MRPYIAGETVTLRVYRGSRKIRVKALTPKPVTGGTAGVATLKVKSAQARPAAAERLAQGHRRCSSR